MHIYHLEMTAAKKEDTVIKQMTLIGEIEIATMTEIAEITGVATRTMTKEVKVAWMLGRNGAFSRLYF
jgi:hypothetical protein